MVTLPFLKSFIKKNPFFLAPMAGVTDKPFRSFMRDLGCGVITSELVSARALREKNTKTEQLVDYEKAQRPFGIQIFGEDSETLSEGAKRAEQLGPDFLDLNLGCPVRKIVKKGAGSALLKDLPLLLKVLRSMRKAVSLPLSLKVRTGWDEKSRNADQVAQMAYEEGFSWMTIHGRTRSQAYSGKADWTYIKEVKSKVPLPIIGNGDLLSAEQAIQALQYSRCDAVMIGRACLHNPWIFLESLSLFDKQALKKEKSFPDLIKKLRNYLENFYDPPLFLLQMKKFSVWFSSGFPHSSSFRKSVFSEKEKDKVLEMVEDFFEKNKEFQKRIPPYEPFLMQGHG